MAGGWFSVLGSDTVGYVFLKLCLAFSKQVSVVKAGFAVLPAEG